MVKNKEWFEVLRTSTFRYRYILHIKSIYS
jgi:hypothetical protein